IERARAWLAKAGIACDLLATLPDGKTIGAVTEALDAGDAGVVIAMGGDGTFREVGAGPLGRKRGKEGARGMRPTGTANEQGRSFGLEAGEGSLEPNLAVIAKQHETRLDAGKMRAIAADGAVTECVFFDSAGWGISARVLA